MRAAISPIAESPELSEQAKSASPVGVNLMADSSDATQTAQQELDAPQQQATGALTLQRSPETAIAIPAERLLGCQLKLTMHKRLALAPQWHSMGLLSLAAGH